MRKKQAAEIDAFSSDHKVPGGVGWTDIYLRQASPDSLGAMKISLTEFDTQVLSDWQRCENVTTGYGTHVEAAEQTIAWKTGLRPIVFADFDTAGLLQHVWLSFPDRQSIGVLQAFFSRCTQHWRMILVDWAWNRIIDLSDDGEVKTYLEQRTE